MTIEDAIMKLQDKPAGASARPTVQYAQDQLEADERVFAAVTANINTSTGHFPGVIVLTDKRVFAACGLPGIKRIKSFPLDQIRSCGGTKALLTYNVFFGTDHDRFRGALSSHAGEKFAPYMADLKTVVSRLQQQKSDEP